jgi:YidC/Oxa1 family membrane protein insertase
MFEIIAKTLSAFYDLVPSYAAAIAMLTLAVMIVTTPFTLKGTRSMIQLQVLQPEMRRIQAQHKDDRQAQNEALMAFYRENNINPLGGCLPMLLQLPVFWILYRVVRGITETNGHGQFTPRYLDHDSAMYKSLTHHDKMLSIGVDLAESASEALQKSFGHALPYLLLVSIVAVSSYFQQRQIQGRNPNAEIPAQQKMLMRVMPAFFVIFAFIEPTALVVYFVTSNLYRIGMQAYITRTLYHGDESLGAQANRATQEAKALRESGGGGPGLLPQVGKRAREQRPELKPKSKPTAPSTPSPAATNGNGTAKPGPTPPRPSGGNRAKNKKKRR